MDHDMNMQFEEFWPPRLSFCHAFKRVLKFQLDEYISCWYYQNITAHPEIFSLSAFN